MTSFGHYLTNGITPLGDTHTYFTIQPPSGFTVDQKNTLPKKCDQDVYRAPIMNEAIRIKTGEKVLGLKSNFDTRKTVDSVAPLLGGITSRIESRDVQEKITTYKPTIFPLLKKADNQFAGLDSKIPVPK